jgi:hypothetical protein
VVSYEGRLLQLERQSRHHAPARSRITLREDQLGKLTLIYRGYTPSPSHPWRRTYKQIAATSAIC